MCGNRKQNRHTFIDYQPPSDRCVSFQPTFYGDTDNIAVLVKCSQEVLPADVNWGLLRGAGEGRPTPSRTSYMAKDTDDPFKWETLFRSKELRYLDAYEKLGIALIPKRVVQMLKLSVTALLSLTLLAGCQMVAEGSETWKRGASKAELLKYYQGICSSYGFNVGTSAMAQCVQTEFNGRNESIKKRKLSKRLDELEEARANDCTMRGGVMVWDQCM